MNPYPTSVPDHRISRRQAMTAVTTSLLAGSLGGSTRVLAAAQPQPTVVPASRRDHEFILFSKPFQTLSFEELGEQAAEVGFNGLELPVRPGGHVRPEEVEDTLPKAIEAFRKYGISVPLIASGINEVNDKQQTEKVLRTAARLGIGRFRMAYYRYDLEKPILPQLESCALKLDDLVALTSELGIKPVYQNHSGDRYVGAPLWDLHSLLRKHSPERVGLAFDIGHAMVEGSKCWPLHFSLVRDYLDTPYFKDPAWSQEQRRFEWAPLGTGEIRDAYYGMLNRQGFAGPVSIHVEYLDDHDPSLHAEFWKAFRHDLKILRAKLRSDLEEGGGAGA